MSTGISNQHYMYMNQAFQDTEAARTSAAEGTVPVGQDGYSQDCSSTDTKKPRHMNSFEKLKNFLKEHNIKSDSIKHIIGKYTGNSDTSNINTLDSKSCEDLLRELKKYVEFEELLKKNSLNLQELFGIDNIFSLSIDGIKETLKQLNAKRRGNKEQVSIQKQIQKSYYCDILEINEKDINTKSVDNFITAAQNVLKRMANGEFKNKSVARQKVLNYTVALNYNWDNIEDFDKFTQKNNDNLISRLKNLGYLENDLSEKAIKDACKRYFNSFKNLKKPKTADPNLTVEEWRTKLLRQTFSKLLINSIALCSEKNDKSNKDLKTILISIQKEYLNEAVENAFMISNGSESKTDIVVKTVADLDPEHYKELSEENIEKTAENIKDSETADKFLKTGLEVHAESSQNGKFNSEELVKKIKNGEELTSEEKEFVKSNDQLSALLKGLASNTKLDNDYILEASSNAIDNVKERSESDYRFLNYNISKSIQKSKLSDDKKSKLIKHFDLISNNNFSKIAENHNAELNPSISIDEIKQRSNNNGIGIKPREDVNVIESQNVVTELQQTIKAQTNVDGNREEAFIVEPTETTRRSDNTPATVIPHTTTASVVSELLHNVQTISVTDIRDFSIGLTPLLKQFSELAASVQNHIKTRLESRSEDEQVRSIDQMDRNSDKVDLALQLKISDDKLDELHLDTNARKNLELQEDVA